MGRVGDVIAQTILISTIILSSSNNTVAAGALIVFMQCACGEFVVSGQELPPEPVTLLYLSTPARWFQGGGMNGLVELELAACLNRLTDWRDRRIATCRG